MPVVFWGTMKKRLGIVSRDDNGKSDDGYKNQTDRSLQEFKNSFIITMIK